MVMIGKDGPRFKFPGEIACHYQKAAMENGEALWAAKMVFLLVGACCDKINALFAQLVGRGMGPRCLPEWHWIMLGRGDDFFNVF